jgi:phosphoglycerate dehydrogenase-like enzyme
MDHPVILFLTERSPRHQQAALDAAPPGTSVVMLRHGDRDAVMARLPQADFLITERAGVIDAAMIAAGTRLRLIQRLGTFTHDIDLDAALAAGIPVFTQSIRGCVMVAEHMLMQMLALLKRLPDATAMATSATDWEQPSRRTDENTFAYNWSKRTGLRGLVDARVGILGFGEIGAELARRLRPFQPAQVLYHKRTRLPSAVEAEFALAYATPEVIYAASDVLCCLLPFAPATEMALDAAVFAAMPTGALLVHCGSGSVIDEAALADAVRSGHLGGAALDTFEWEPLRPDNPLVALARDPAMNVLLTPHTAAGSGSGRGGRFADYVNVVRVLEGKSG